MIDYRNFRTPYFKVEIGDSEGKNFIELPSFVYRLIEKVEIQETFVVGGKNDSSTITLTFVESGAPSHLSGLNTTYKPGMLTDLTFGEKKITFLTEAEVASTPSTSKVRTVNGKEIVETYKTQPKRPAFLLQERNAVRVTWGYKQNNVDKVRSSMMSITIVATNYAENGTVKTTVTCGSGLIPFENIAPTKGKPFAKVERSTKGNSIVVFEEPEVPTLIKDICSKSGMDCVVSENLPTHIIGSGKQVIWAGGENFNQFIKRLAEKHDAYYTIEKNPKTGVDTLFFVSKEDFEARTVISDPVLLHYKAPGSIIKSIDIKADFGAFINVTKAGVDKEGKPVSTTSQVETRVFNVPGGNTPQVRVDADPVSDNNPNKAVKGLQESVLDGKSTGLLHNTPNEDVGSNQVHAQAMSDDKSRIINIDFTTIGYTGLTPGVVEIKGIGLRYSGKYRLQSVIHTIDSNGYTTKCSGVSSWLSAGGVQIPDASKGQEKEAKLVDVGLFTPRDQIDKFKGL